ncbi:nuclear transport factor 2 family protein [Novosphingobium sp.]|uniref:nuclear transport factor 2 family protein n=1 Tax=Novosphingobium sp. TaxID=1874826 RepID=UPI002FDB442F
MNLDSRNSLLIAAVVAALAICGPARMSRASASEAAAAAPGADAFLALQKSAKEARIRGDGKFFGNLLSDKFVKQMGGVRVGKAEVVKLIGDSKCEVKTGWTLTEPHLLKINDDAYALTYVSDMQGTCATGGKAEKIPSPVRAATIWVRNGKTWQVAFHGENLIVNPAAQPETDKKTQPAKSEAANAKSAGARSSETAADPITGALMAAENAVWAAWKDKDAKRLERLTARQIAFVDIFGTHFDNKADTIKDWTGPICQVKNFTLINGTGTTISPGVAILTLTATVNGACGGQDISGLKVYGNSVYVKDGHTWKWVFGFNSPT